MPREIRSLAELPPAIRQRALREQAAQTELATNRVRQLTLADVDAAIDAISNLADLKAFLKHVVKYLIAQRR